MALVLVDTQADASTRRVPPSQVTKKRHRVKQTARKSTGSRIQRQYVTALPVVPKPVDDNDTSGSDEEVEIRAADTKHTTAEMTAEDEAEDEILGAVDEDDAEVLSFEEEDDEEEDAEEEDAEEEDANRQPVSAISSDTPVYARLI